MLIAMYSVFVFIFIGYMAKVLRLLGNKQSGILLGFLLNFALPAQIFNGTYHANITFSFLSVCLVGFVCSCLAGCILFGIGKILKLDRSNLVVLFVVGTLGNTLFLGLPLVNGALGDSYANQVIIYDQFVTGIPFAFLAPIILALSGKGRFSFRGVSIRLFKSPLFLSLICGFIFRLIPFSLPDELFIPLRSLAQTATPLALFAIGVQMNLKSILNWKLTDLLLSVKMIVAPLLLFCFVVFMSTGFTNTYPIREAFSDTWRMALIETAMPPQISTVAIIIKAGFNGELALNAVAFGILASFIIVPMWVYISYL